jgi:hypothetical protein
MGSHSGPEIVNNGLVFTYDMGNPLKSWKGAPATNLITETNLNNWTKSATTSTSNFQTPYKLQAYSITDSNAADYSSISRNITVANNSSSYTVSLFVKKTTGATSARLGFNIGFNTGGTTVSVNARFNSDTGVATTGTVVSQGDWWYWYFTISNNGTGNTNLFCNFYPATGPYNSSDNVIGVGTAIIGELMIVAGSVQARFVSGTRSNTQAILDWTGKNTITANSLTYNVDGTASFGSSDNNLQVPHSTNFNFNGTFTVSAWIKINSFNTSSIYNIVSKKASFNNTQKGWSCQYDYRTTGVLQFRNNDGTVLNDSTPTSTIDNTSLLNQTTAWVNSVWVISGVNIFFYINGNQRQNSTATFTNTDTTNSIYIGKTVGSIADPAALMNLDNLNIYNRALTAAEVQQNFNALRGRYGL